ncbi:hypothetical protein Tco_0005614 [Tanacetum coccineum]
MNEASSSSTFPDQELAGMIQEEKSSRVMENPNKHTNPVRDQRVVNKKHARHNRIKGIEGVTERVKVLQREHGIKSYLRKLKKRIESNMKNVLTTNEEMVKEANAKIAEMFAQYTQQLSIPPP